MQNEVDRAAHTHFVRLAQRIVDGKAPFQKFKSRPSRKQAGFDLGEDDAE